MRLTVIMLISLTLFSCQKETKAPASDGISGAGSSAAEAGNGKDFSFDKKEKDESCDTEEDLEKQIEEAKKKKEAFKLQGNDGGCTVD